MSTRAGSLRCPLTIQKPPETDGFTDDPENAKWRTVGTLFASPITKGGVEKFVQAEQVALIQYAFRSRYARRLEGSKARLIYKGRLLNVEFAVDPDGKEKDMLIGCTQVVKT